jgi:DNA topoisomerase-3
MRLYLCEKPSQGKDIARVLGATGRGLGCLRGAGIVVTWCIGHLLEAVPPEGYDEQFKKWSLEQLPILPVAWRMAPKKSSAAQLKVVKALIGQATELVIATDADREGEMIAREVIELAGFKGPIQRLWLSALNDASIRKALGELRPGKQTLPLYHAALARSRADWLMGMNLTRLFTLLAQKSGHSGVLTVGRVQTPTLRLVTERDREIARFVSVPYWTIEVILSHGGSRFMAQWVAPEGLTDTSGRCINERGATEAFIAIRAGAVAQVTSVETERVREAPPLPFDLSTLQSACSNRLGLDVQETLEIAQSLYETHKATTYPRADTGYLPESMFAEVPMVIVALRKTDPEISRLINEIDTGIRSRAWNDARVSAHHGIIPTLEPTNLSAMNEKERAVYDIIRAHYLAQFLPHHEYDRTTVLLESAGKNLQATGKRVIIPGWHLALAGLRQMPDEAASRAQILPPLDKGNTCPVMDIELKALKTLPPKHYTQAELVSAMKGIARFVTDPELKQKLKETTGIGTEATRAAIIQGLLQRGYLFQKGRVIRASEAAFALIEAVPAALSDAGTTAVWEQALDMIATGQMHMDLFLEKQSVWITFLVDQYRTRSLTMDVPDGPACPLCKAPMRKINGKTGPFWSCSRYPDCRGSQAIGNAKTSSKTTSRGRAPPKHRRTAPKAVQRPKSR